MRAWIFVLPTLLLTALAACDAAGPTPGDTAADLGADLPADPAPADEAPLPVIAATPVFTGRAPMAGVDAPPLANATCEEAVLIGAGGIQGVPVTGGTLGGPCSSPTYASRWYRVVVPPHQSARVTATGPVADAGGLWLQVAPSCKASADVCNAQDGWTWLDNGVVIANPGGRFLERRVAVVMYDPPAGATTYDVAVRFDDLAPNATCDAPTPLAGPLHGASFAGAGIVASSGCGLRQALWYRVTIPAWTRLEPSVTTESWGLNAFWFEDACPGPGAAPGLLPQSVMANASDAPKEALLAVGTFFGEQDAFDLDFESSAIDPGATCANAARLGVGDAVVAKVDGGPPGPAVCWCSSPDRVAFVDVDVPAGTTVDVRGVIANDDGNAQLQIVELASACADECGTNAAFGGSTFPATLRLDNAGETRETHHLIVLSQAGWDAEDPAAPPVRVEVVEAN